MAAARAGNIIGIVGYKDTGKTRVVQGLITYLSGKGFSVGTVKHIDHDASLRPLATDSRRHLDAGARTVVVVGEGIVEILKSEGSDPDVGDRVGYDLEATMAAYLSACDYVVVEGFKKESIPKVAVMSDDKGILNEAGNIVAVVSSDEKPGNIPTFQPDDIEKLGAHLLENEIIKAQRGGVSLVVDGKPIRLNEFVRTSLAGVIRGFITGLRDVRDPNTVELRITK